MFDSFCFKSLPRQLGATEVKALRGVVNLGIADIKARAAQRLPLLEFPVFDNDWQDSKKTIERLLDGIKIGELPLEVYGVTGTDNDSLEEEPLTVKGLHEALAVLRCIEREQDMLTQLELGHISSRDDYIPDDGDA